MFGFQRTGDNFWAFGDARGRGFLMGGTAGRTTLNGEGLQHQDGHSLLLASSIPNILAYDPAFAYEIAAIIREGLRRMYEAQEDIFYYVTLYNENITHPPMPQGIEEGILKGLYRFRPAEAGARSAVNLFGSGTILQSVLKAQRLLSDQYGIAADVWSATSYQQLRNEALSADRWNRLHPEAEPRRPYVESLLEEIEGPIVAAADFVKAVPDMIRPWVRREFVTLGTDGFGRSDTREALRRHFEVDAEHIVVAALYALLKTGQVPASKVSEAIRTLGIDADGPDPLHA
jgi:pyruvate dehydrogenase E1 component